MEIQITQQIPHSKKKSCFKVQQHIILFKLKFFFLLSPCKRFKWVEFENFFKNNFCHHKSNNTSIKRDEQLHMSQCSSFIWASWWRLLQERARSLNYLNTAKLLVMQLSNSQVVQLCWIFIRHIFILSLSHTWSKITVGDTLSLQVLSLCLPHESSHGLCSLANTWLIVYIYMANITPCLLVPCELKALWTIFHKTLNWD